MISFDRALVDVDDLDRYDDEGYGSETERTSTRAIEEQRYNQIMTELNEAKSLANRIQQENAQLKREMMQVATAVTKQDQFKQAVEGHLPFVEAVRYDISTDLRKLKEILTEYVMIDASSTVLASELNKLVKEKSNGHLNKHVKSKMKMLGYTPVSHNGYPTYKGLRLVPQGVKNLSSGTPASYRSPVGSPAESFAIGGQKLPTISTK